MNGTEEIKSFSSFGKPEIEIYNHISRNVPKAIDFWHRKSKVSIVLERSHGGYMTLDKRIPKSPEEIESELIFNPENLEPNTFYIDILAGEPVIYRKNDEGIIEFYRTVEV